jgi:hypothetical protein
MLRFNLILECRIIENIEQGTSNVIDALQDFLNTYKGKRNTEKLI